ncbi:TonB-dependent siderophore receptor [Acinetobacter sp. VNH17]|uniref:TonB-dependent siderophore receptor n=1 Tax=Acinetobacter thutiue TaxID=2998078 RepID=A0ABT7WJP4_9GAMM|nr:TonB-dependent receptor [Acinetobacter thutiue]MCY6410790.1 TonB-dependent siderophore receptor [Acinetobacter thutiue]MDN0012892.1 TonB-dependent siderophore receptor [Acinetobacter thutiue]
MKDDQAKSRLALAIRAVLWGIPVIVTSISASSVYAANVYSISIAQTTLDQALKQLAIQTGTTISYDTTALAKIKSVSLKGNYAVDEALEQLLKSSTFEAVKLNNGGYTIRSIDIKPENSPKVVVLEPIHTQAQQSRNTSTIHESNSTQLPTISIKAANQQNVANIGKSAQDIKEIPQSVTVMSRQRIDEQGLKTLDDVLLQTTGVTREQLWLNNNYSARGLKIENIRYDGGSTASLQDRSNSADLAQYDSVEVLRGADGLFGAGEAGGVINLTSKRPKAETEINGTVSAGSWNNYRGELDATGSLTQDQSIKGRLVTVFHDQDFFYKPAHNRREMVYGALSFDLLPETTLFTGASYQKDKTDAFNASLPRWEDGADMHLPRSTTMGAPWGWIERENISVFANLQHQINDNWKTQLNLRHNIGNDNINGAEMEGAVSYSTHENQWWRYQDDTNFKETTLDLNLQGSFNLFEQKHDVILGIDHTNNQKDYKQNWTYYADGNAINRVAPPEWDYPPAAWETDNTNESRQSALYGSFKLRPIDDLALIVGGRYTFKNELAIENHNTNIRNTYTEDKKFVPYYGITYDILPSTTAYASFAEIYKNQRNYLVSVDGPGLDPLTGKNIEFGFKHQINSSLLASIAYFNIKKEKEAVYNTRASIPNSNSSCCYIGTGTMESKGVDIELNGNITPDWNFSMGYTYNKNEKKDNTNNPYNTYTPKHLLKLWTTYQLDQIIDGLEVGGGVTAQSKNYAKGSVRAFNPVTQKFDGAWNAIEIVQPQYAIWSARIAYDINPKWNVALNLNNIFDKTYYSTIGYPGYGNFYGEPRSFLLTLKANY